MGKGSWIRDNRLAGAMHAIERVKMHLAASSGQKQNGDPRS